jgi:hypothetical protein
MFGVRRLDRFTETGHQKLGTGFGAEFQQGFRRLVPAASAKARRRLSPLKSGIRSSPVSAAAVESLPPSGYRPTGMKRADFQHHQIERAQRSRIV